MNAYTLFDMDEYLDRLMEKKISCTVIMTNGYQLPGTEILAHSKDAVLMKAPGIREQTVYKHAISTVRPPYPLYGEGAAGDGHAGPAD